MDHHLLKVEKLTQENDFIGYKLTVDKESEYFFMDSSRSWPQGWRARRYKPSEQMMRSQMAPQEMELFGAQKDEDIINYGRERGVTVKVNKYECNDSEDRWNVHVEKEDYKTVIDPEFWELSGWKVRALID